MGSSMLVLECLGPVKHFLYILPNYFLNPLLTEVAPYPNSLSLPIYTIGREAVKGGAV